MPIRVCLSSSSVAGKPVGKHSPPKQVPNHCVRGVVGAEYMGILYFLHQYHLPAVICKTPSLFAPREWSGSTSFSTDSEFQTCGGLTLRARVQRLHNA